MTRLFRLAAMATPVSLAIAMSLSAPACASDTRLASRPYNPDEVVRLDGKLNVQATIAFGEDEQIENVAVGDSDSWQITPNKRADLLFVKPLVDNTRTNMTVVTDRHTYYFELVASPVAKPLFALRFTYAEPPAGASAPAAAVLTLPAAEPAPAPAPVPVAPAALAAVARPAAETAMPAARPAPRTGERRRSLGKAPAADQAAAAAAAAPAEVPPNLAQIEAVRREVLSAPGPQVEASLAAAPPRAAPGSSGWRKRGDGKLLPSSIRSDGSSTYAAWAPGVPIPKIFAVDAAGAETEVAYDVQGDGIVIAGVPARLVLRSGKQSARLDHGERALAVTAPALPQSP